MKIIYNKLIPFKGFIAINLFGALFVKKGTKLTKTLINHEAIHTAQMKELLYIPFYLLYILEWVFNLFKYNFNNKEAYKNISFEKEAYDNQSKLSYLAARKNYAMWK